MYTVGPAGHTSYKDSATVATAKEKKAFPVHSSCLYSTEFHNEPFRGLRKHIIRFFIWHTDRHFLTFNTFSVGDTEKKGQFVV